jgi:UDP-2-acetamido-3-amino-2,3-dideoxy-glucuronate N-acetyltransferase
MTETTPFIGMIGAGYWGKNILRNLHELGVLHTICDTDQTRLDGYRSEYSQVALTTSVADVLGNDSVRAVAIAAPAHTHYELVRAALDGGKDVFVEKPLALTLSQGEDLVKRAETLNRVLMVGHILQYHPAVVRLKALIGDGALGKIHYIYSNRLNIGKLRTEENILWSFAPHDISVILSLMEEEPQRVAAFGADYINHGIYDVTLTTLEFANDVKAHIFVSWLHPFKEQKLIVVGSKAMAVFDDVTQEKLVVYPHTITWKEGKIPVAEKADYYPVKVERKEPLKEELQHFLTCVLTRKQPRTDGYEGLRVLAVLEEAERSLQTGRNAVAVAATRRQDFFVHDTAVVDDDSSIGSGSRIWHFTHVLKHCTVGKNCIIGQNVMIGPEVTIGDGCKIQNNVSVFKGVTLEDRVFCGPSCVFTNVYNPRAFIERKKEFRPTLVKSGATIGANATIICGNTVGSYAMIGAGAVVTADVADHALVTGVPARQIGWVCKCGATLPDVSETTTKTCDYCGSTYRIEDGQLVAVT